LISLTDELFLVVEDLVREAEQKIVGHKSISLPEEAAKAGSSDGGPSHSLRKQARASAFSGLA
jgi:hypothetical protein